MAFMSPDDLRQLSLDTEKAELEKALAKKRRAAQAEEELKQSFEGREVAPEAMDRINTLVRAAAEQGLHEVQVLRFPAMYCNDHGRAINNFDPAWPDSLEGFGKTAFNYYQAELEPLGYQIRAQIVSYPDGLLGDVGLYLRW